MSGTGQVTQKGTKFWDPSEPIPLETHMFHITKQGKSACSIMLDFSTPKMSIWPVCKSGVIRRSWYPEFMVYKLKVMYLLGTTFGSVHVQNRIPHFVNNETFN